MSDKLKDDVWAALQVASKPITEENALAVALKALEGYPTEIFKFSEWFKSNGAGMVKRLNA